MDVTDRATIESSLTNYDIQTGTFEKDYKEWRKDESSMKSIQYSRLFGSVRGAVLLKMMSCAAACQRLLLFEVDCRFVRPPFLTCYVVHLQIYCFYGPCNFNDKYTAHWYWFYYVLLELLSIHTMVLKLYSNSHNQTLRTYIFILSPSLKIAKRNSDKE